MMAVTTAMARNNFYYNRRVEELQEIEDRPYQLVPVSASVEENPSKHTAGKIKQIPTGNSTRIKQIPPRFPSRHESQKTMKRHLKSNRIPRPRQHHRPVQRPYYFVKKQGGLLNPNLTLEDVDPGYRVREIRERHRVFGRKLRRSVAFGTVATGVIVGLLSSYNLLSSLQCQGYFIGMSCQSSLAASGLAVPSGKK